MAAHPVAARGRVRRPASPAATSTAPPASRPPPRVPGSALTPRDRPSAPRRSGGRSRRSDPVEPALVRAGRSSPEPQQVRGVRRCSFAPARRHSAPLVRPTPVPDRVHEEERRTAAAHGVGEPPAAPVERPLLAADEVREGGDAAPLEQVVRGDAADRGAAGHQQVTPPHGHQESEKAPANRPAPPQLTHPARVARPRPPPPPRPHTLWTRR